MVSFSTFRAPAIRARTVSRFRFRPRRRLASHKNCSTRRTFARLASARDSLRLRQASAFGVAADPFDIRALFPTRSRARRSRSSSVDARGATGTNRASFPRHALGKASPRIVCKTASSGRAPGRPDVKAIDVWPPRADAVASPSSVVARRAKSRRRAPSGRPDRLVAGDHSGCSCRIALSPRPSANHRWPISKSSQDRSNCDRASSR